jgi:hypothetical protein
LPEEEAAQLVATVQAGVGEAAILKRSEKRNIMGFAAI